MNKVHSECIVEDRRELSGTSPALPDFCGMEPFSTIQT